MMNADEIAALALLLAERTAAHQLSSMQLRGVLEFLRGRGYLVKPQEPLRCACEECRP
jgi:hypothetical protein